MSNTNPWGEYTPWFKRPGRKFTHLLTTTLMNSIDLTEQVFAQLGHYAERIAYLQSIGDDKSAEVLIKSGELMAEAADSQDDWLIAQLG